MAEYSGRAIDHLLGFQENNMTIFEWIIASLVLLIFAGKDHIYYRVFSKKVEEVRTEIGLVRTNDLKHIEDRFEQLSDQIFQLAKKD